MFQSSVLKDNIQLSISDFNLINGTVTYEKLAKLAGSNLK